MEDEERMACKCRTILGLISGLASVCFVAILHASTCSTIVLTPDEKIVCAVNQDSGSISLWNRLESRKVHEVAVGVEPRTLAISPDGRTAYVTLQSSQALAIVDLEGALCTATIKLPGQPIGVVLSTNGRRAFVSQFAGDYIDGIYSSGTIAVVDLVRRLVIKKIPVKPFPFALAFDDKRRNLYVTHFFALDGVGFVSVIDTENCELRSEILLSEDDDVSSGSGGVFTAISSIAIHPFTARALVVGVHANVRRGLSQSRYALSHKTTMQAVVRVIDLDKIEEVPLSRIISSFSGQAVAMPSSVAFLPSGKHFIDVYSVSHDFKLIAYNERGIVAERALFELPAGPTGLALTRDGRTAFFNCRWARSIAQVTIADIRRPKLAHEIQVARESWSELRVLGARVFHNSRDTRMTPNRWLACGCCHLDGGHLSDNLVWEFTEKQKPSSPRFVNTKALSITGFSAPPILIQGMYHLVQEEEKFVRSFLGGSGFLEKSESLLPAKLEGKSRELDGLAAFVLELRPRPNPHMDGARPRLEILESARRGQRLFKSPSIGCNRCHQGSRLTISGSLSTSRLFDVGTGIRADVPSLHALWASAPYLHDGRAMTLRDVITTYNLNDRHGRTSHLTPSEVEDLVHFLLAPFDEPTGQ